MQITKKHKRIILFKLIVEPGRSKTQLRGRDAYKALFKSRILSRGGHFHSFKKVFKIFNLELNKKKFGAKHNL